MRAERSGRHRREKSRRWVIPASMLFVLVVASTGTALERRDPSNASAEPLLPSASVPTPRPTDAVDVAEQPTARSNPRPSEPREDTSSEADVAVTDSPVVVPRKGAGTFRLMTRPKPDHAPSELELTYTVEIEDGLPFPGGHTARTIETILEDPRGWLGVEGQEFHRVQSSGQLRILVATPTTTDELCAPLDTRGRVSCRNGDLVVINARRWAFGIEDYRGRLDDYRIYVVNHEVGHLLGRSHVECPGSGEPAPVMLQQTYGLDGCLRNPWPSVA